MEDVLTSDPPPSRFFPDDLDNFSSPSPPIPLPSLDPPNPNPKNTNVLIILISPSSLSLLPPSKTLISSLPSPTHISFYSVSDPPSAIIAAVHRRIDPDRSKPIAKMILDEFKAGRVVILDSIRGENYRGRLAADENPMVFKLETRAERREGGRGLEGVEWLGSGSLVEGLGAAVMGECEMRRRKAAMVVTWPEGGKAVARVLKGIVMGLGVEVGDGGGDGGGKSAYWLDSGLYT